MIEKHELSALARTMGATVRAVVEPLVVEVRQLRAEVAALQSAEPPAAGRDGRDADPEAIRSMVAEAVAALPPPPAGEPGRDADMAALTAQVADEVRSAVAALPTAAAGPAGPTGPAGPAGRAADPVDMVGLRSELRGMVDSVVAELPPPPAGPAGRDAAPVDLAALGASMLPLLQAWQREMIDSVVAELRQTVDTALAALEPVAGPAGPPGPAGHDAPPLAPETIRELLTLETGQMFAELTLRMSSMVQAAVSAIPAAQPGRDGEPGRPGKDAEPLHPDTVRLMVVEAVRAAIAEAPKPQDGEKGDAGRDAVEVEILSSLQEGRSYPRGTYAHHAGGIVRAVRTTDPKTEGAAISSLGWEVVVDGLHRWNVDQSADQRTFAISAESTSGRVHTSEFSLPALIYREIYRAGDTYERGDVVTYGGSAWHCAADSTKAKPGASPDWRLMVKEGREGKAGAEGKAGKDGAAGRPGRDLTQISSDGSKH